jgi:hypothetical protein
MKDYMTTLALKQRKRTLNPVRGWQVWQCGKMIYDSNFKALCDYYVKSNALKGAQVKPIA